MSAPSARSFARARHLPATVLWIAAAAVGAWRAGDWLASQPDLSGPAARVPVAVGAPLLVTVLLTRTLVGGDPDLERTAPRFTPVFRTVHALLGAIVAALALALALLADPAVFGAAAVVRNTLGLVGLTLIAAVLAPVQLAWAPAVLVAFATYLAAGHAQGAGVAWWGWLVRPGGADASWVVAGVLLALGACLYARRGVSR